jgi:hypothetical protein
LLIHENSLRLALTSRSTESGLSKNRPQAGTLPASAAKRRTRPPAKVQEMTVNTNSR